MMVEKKPNFINDLHWLYHVLISSFMTKEYKYLSTMAY